MSSGGESISILEPPTPTPSTSSLGLSIAQQQQQQPSGEQPPQLQGVQEAFQIPHILSSAVFSILWLFGLARNLATYVVSLGIIPLQTATQLFGLKAHPHPLNHQHSNTHNIHLKRDVDRKHGSRHTHHSHPRSEKTSSATGTSSVSSGRTHHVHEHTWASHKPGKHGPLSSTDSTNRTRSAAGSGSVPSTPHQRARTSLPPVEPSTDSEAHHLRLRTRHIAPTSRTVNFEDAPVNEQGELVDGDGKRTRSRSRVDHSTRRILFVDPKNARRQTAPPVPYQPSSSGAASAVAGHDEEARHITESPVHETIALPSAGTNTRKNDTAPRPKSSPEQITSASSTNEFGEFISAPAPVNSATLPHDDHDVAASGTESVGERKSRGKDRFRSGFRLFAKKRSSSVASNGDVPPTVTVASGHASDINATTSFSKTISATTGTNTNIGLCGSKLRRKSPYPGRVDTHHSPNIVANGLVGVAPAIAVSVSDAEMPSTAWLRSRPKKLTRRARSNSLNESARVQRPEDVSTASKQIDNAPAPTQQPPTPLIRSSTMASTSTSASASSKDPQKIAHNPSISTSTATPTSSKRTSFNPLRSLRDLEAHLYYRHGVGTGPATHDVSTYVTTPVPKSGIKRTNPYVLLGGPSPSSAVLVTGSPKPSRRVSAPAGGSGGAEVDENVALAVPVPVVGNKRPTTPSRAHTQPL